MSLQVSVTVDGGKAFVDSPYHPDFPAKARRIGGAFKARRWVFDARDEQRVRELCTEVYGTDGTGTRTVTVQYSLHGTGGAQSVWRFGRRIAHRSGRDNSVDLGEQVLIKSGGFPGSGGSVKNPRLETKDETIVLVRDVPAAHPDLTRDDEDVLEVVEDQPRSSRVDELKAERERLRLRLEEIDGELEELEGLTA